MSFRPSNRQLEYFVAVCESGHFGAAAKACNVSQPTLSAQLKLLEQQLGAALVERDYSGARPTPAGTSILPLARSILASLDELVVAAGARSAALGGLIHLGVASTFGPYFLPYFLPGLHKRFPDLEVYVREDRPVALAAALEERSVDCIMTPLPLPPNRFEVVALCEEDILLGVPARHPIAKFDKIEPRMLAGENLLTLGHGYRLYTNVKALADASNATLREDYEGTSLDAIRQMVSIGMGFSLFPELYVRSEFRRERNVVLHSIDRWPMVRTICLAWRKQSLRHEHFRCLAEEAVKTARSLSLRLTGQHGTPKNRIR
jgi:LysR family hydrogen peroxide-inducible transcriptional activator